MLGHLKQARVSSKEVLAEVSARFGRILLPLPIDDLPHAFDQQALTITGEQRVPIASPDHLDHVPSRTSKDSFQFLNDVAVAPHRTIEALKVAVDNEDEIIELLSRGEGNRPK